MSIFRYKSYELDYIIIRPDGALPPKRWILAFPGFGRPARDFEIFHSLLAPDEAICAINLLGMNGSVIHEKLSAKTSITRSQHKELIESFTSFLNIESFSLLGYSLGGKIAMITLELFADRIERMMLIAPDGVKVNKIYKFASNKALGRTLFRWIVYKPGVFLFTLKSLKRLKIISAKVYNFVHLNMESREKRERVGTIWLIYRHFVPDIERVQHEINNRHIPFSIIYGRYDRVIKPWQGKKLNRGLEKDSLHILESGHLLLEANTISYIRDNNLW